VVKERINKSLTQNHMQKVKKSEERTITHPSIQSTNKDRSPSHPDAQPTNKASAPSHPNAQPTNKASTPSHPDAQPTNKASAPSQPDVQSMNKPSTPSHLGEPLTNAKRSLNMDSESRVLTKPDKPIRAIYVTSYVANSSRMKELVHLVEHSELNAMVLDINSGIHLSAVANASTNPKFKPSNKKSAERYRQTIQELKKHNIYLIARIATFKDPNLANTVPAWALKTKSGKVWRDRGGTSWIDPYREEAWEYILDLAAYAAQLGFDEIQYDYVRFPENATKVDAAVVYANKRSWTKSEVIGQFLHRASSRSHRDGLRVSADVFGMVGSENNDMGIGQSWDSIVKEVDIIAPMIYPSHYAAGIWGIDHPDLSPSAIIAHALRDAAKRNRQLNQNGISTAHIRPWLQSFTAGWIHPHQKYGARQINEQIQAARKEGFTSYMLWNSSNKYPVYST
jgi:hypothetical protein